ncbi:MAG: phenylalanine--tRNA ligase subunit beta [Saprospiraceae bacterium]|nr:phenylalanine--tRNA ligase subunit beta [Saprospiraceae bacterium]
MRISLNWLRNYIDISETPEEISNILTSLGLEVESLEIEEEIKGGLKGVIVAEVVECWKHPGADRLHLTKVNTGAGELLQVVCGAPNVAAGQKVFLATEGTTLYPFSGESFTIKKGKIRGEASDGMLCAEDELGISANHDGLLILNPDAVPGTQASEYLNLSSDIIFEIGLTPNRADATSHLGVAKDLLAWYRVHKDPNKKLIELDVADLINSTSKMKIEVEVEDTNLCPRYSGICISGIKVQESPVWLKKAIRSMGLNPINNVVDVTNFIMYEMGQPLHAFDYDHIKGHLIKVKTLESGKTFKTLDGVDRKLMGSDLMICDGSDQPLCLAGVFGGIGSGVSDATTKIFIESAHFNASAVRKSSMSHVLRTQSAKCFEKGSDPNITIFALKRTVYLLKQIGDANIDFPLIDLYPNPINPSEINLNIENAIQLSGLSINTEEIKQVLFALDMELQDLQNGNLMVSVPTNKPDVKRAADLVEEISRVYGFDKIPIPGKIQISFQQHIASNYLLRKQIAAWLTSNSLHEIMSLSFVKSDICLQSDAWKAKDLVYIHNTSNVHLDAMKPSICIGGLEAIQFNSNRQQSDLGIYEMGREYIVSNGQILEKEKLGIWLTGFQTQTHWSNPKPATQDFFKLKSIVDGIVSVLNINQFSLTEIKSDVIFEFGVQYLLNNNIVIKAGKLSKKLSSLFDLKKEVWFAEFDLELIFSAIPTERMPFKEFSKFPQVKRDLALVIDKKVEFQVLKEIAVRQTGDLLKELQLFDVYENADQIGANKKSYALSFTFESLDRQMSSEEMEQLMNGLIKVYEKEVGAFIRK